MCVCVCVFTPRLFVGFTEFVNYIILEAHLIGSNMGLIMAKHESVLRSKVSFFTAAACNSYIFLTKIQVKTWHIE